MNGLLYDENGNIKTLSRSGARNNLTTFGSIDGLSYEYLNNTTLGDYSNKLIKVTDSNTAAGYVSKDFKPNTASTQNYGYDDNGNQNANKDKKITSIKYNHLNLPYEINFEGTIGKILYDYNAEGKKLKQRVYTNSTLSSTTDYVGEFIFVNNAIDYIVHEEGRVVFEEGNPFYEFFIKDHLGNVRQVLSPKNLVNLRLATMESANEEVEGKSFTQIKETRQREPKHNITAGGQEVAWLNASRGRKLGPATSFEVFEGDTVKLSVYGKYEARKEDNLNKGSMIPASDAEKVITDLGPMTKSGVFNPMIAFQLVDLIAKDLQKKEAPEAYMTYYLYDSDSNLYDQGRKILSKKAANQHEELKESIYIGKTGYIETYVANETYEDVWFDNFRVLANTPLIVQETHYDPWGLELTGLGYQYQAPGLKVNKYLYQGKEWITDHNVNIFDFHARGYDPAIVRTLQIDPMAESFYSLSPYSWVINNPLMFTDPTGMFADYFDGSGKYKGSDGNDNGEIRVLNEGSEKVPNLYKEDGKTVDEKVGKSNSNMLDKINFTGNEKALSNILDHYLSVLGYEKNGKVQYDQQSTMRGDPIKNSTLISLNQKGYLNFKEFNNYYNLMNTAVHEQYHIKNHLGVDTKYTSNVGALNHLQAYYAQINHSTWGKTTSGHQTHIIDNIGLYLTYVNPNKRTNELNKFQSKLGINYEWIHNQGYRKWSSKQ